MAANPLHTCISGAQIGADIAGLRAAHACGLTTGGWMPKGYKTKVGPLPYDQVKKYNLWQTQDTGYPTRTRMNVEGSDGTIQLAYNWDSAGEKLTTRLIKEYDRPSFQVGLFLDEHGYVVLSRPTMVLMACEWIKNGNIGILNVAGNDDTAIEQCVEEFLTAVFKKLQT